MKNKFCLDSVTSFKQINQSQVNRSTTKKTYSFSKSSRFYQPSANCPFSTYETFKKQSQSKGAGIGYGRRSDFTKCLTVSPSSTKYQLQSCFDKAKKIKQGAYLGASRNEVAFNSYISQQAAKVPGPNIYNNQKKARASSPAYSMRKKTSIKDLKMTIEPQNENPGPGSYNNPELRQTGQNFSSRYQRLIYSPSRSQRFFSSDNKVPGPGKYGHTNLSNNGKYTLSKNKGGTLAKFDKQERTNEIDRYVKSASYKPGPGFYRVPSQFGQYDGDVYGARMCQTANKTAKAKKRIFQL